ncbi:alpha/beta fold hydrolase [Chroococcidiopsis sp. TS-821]|uniref:alpha/beta fold hydrolase n=1 Tax=Chroococcidiopsis sp. TS-821 TaxID=1378066 RepID=UPI000CEE8B8D|nr:alpha/beta hydrolase [Chroococcidiopsis sp. TS-821]PPS43501.1 alpha/beta hydrolase [Chroococcidiopsis sp. TS-821]
MLQFQPPGFGQGVVQTSLGLMVYYTPVDPMWASSTFWQKETVPTLVFLHSFGGGASAYEWSKVYPAFASDYRVLAPDLIGWGQSTHPVRNYQIDDYLTTIAEFIQKTCPHRAIAVASSLTAALVIRLAVQQPNLFQSLVLICPSGFDDFGQGAGRRLPLQLIGTPLLNDLIYSVGAQNELAVRNFLQRFLFAKPDRVTEEMVAAYLTSAQQPNAKYAALAFLQGELYFDLARYIPQLTVPTGMIWGEAAQFTSLELGRRLAQLNPQAIRKFQAIASTGVLPHLETPEIVIGLLQLYLQTLAI